jgi:two-component system, NarL family, sensor histidine kinase UhpB
VSLRLRLIIFPVVIVLAGLAALAYFEVNAARDRVHAETVSSLQLGRIIVRQTVSRLAGAPDAPAAIAAALPSVRHARLAVVVPPGASPPVDSALPTAPHWFARLVTPPATVERFPILQQGRVVGEVVMIARPDDELGEIWADWRSLALVLGLLSAVIIVVVVVSVALALRPLTAFAEGFDRLEKGDFDVAMAPVRDAELRRLGERFNSLVSSLAQVRADNRLLIDRLMSLQEAERKEIAHELHDEFGPSLFGIRADLSTIGGLAKRREPRFDEIEDRVRSMSGLVEQIQKINSRMLEKLRPLVLDHMGLGEAMKRLVGDWQTRYPAIDWRLLADDVDGLGEIESLALYRAAQECLTNVVRHADARAVRVSLRRRKASVTLTVSDDGRGFSHRRFGFGLLGMAERARALGGKLKVSAVEGGGSLVSVVLPMGASK